MFNVTRQDANTKEQDYFFTNDGETGWNLVYKEFTFPQQDDIPPGAVKASLFIQRNYQDKKPGESRPTIEHFNEAIYDGLDGKITRWSSNLGFSISFVLDDLKELDEPTRNQIISSLSPEARSLLEKGLAEYKPAE